MTSRPSRAPGRHLDDLRVAALGLLPAPDGHAVLLTLDGGATWRYVGLDVGTRPLYCRHHELRGRDAASLFRGAPTSAALAMEALQQVPNHGLSSIAVVDAVRRFVVERGQEPVAAAAVREALVWLDPQTSDDVALLI